MLLKDQLDRELQLNSFPKRIVSLVPSQTELLVDLGLETAIVGLTKFCVHPSDLRKTKTVVGGTKTINIHKIKVLRPDIILCNMEENTEAIVEALKDIAPIHISDIQNLEDCYELITMYGDIFNVVENANKILDTIKAERKAFKNRPQNQGQLKAAYFIWKNPWMVVGSHTFIHSMMNEAGLVNVFKTMQRYPEISLEDAKLNEADYLLLSSEPYPFKENDIAEMRLHFPNKTIKIVDGEMFSWYGSRLIRSFSYFQNIFKT